MCSLNWHKFPEHIGIAFNRDESVKRSKAHPPSIFTECDVSYLMPIDPDGNGSWIAVNEFGFAVMLLNDYQGQLKPQSADLVSRGQLVKRVAVSRNWTEVERKVNAWSLSKSQPFQLVVMHINSEPMLWHYDGIKQKVEPQQLSTGLYSSGHPAVVDILAARHRYMAQQRIEQDADLIEIHRSHVPENNMPLDAADKRAHAFCMHRPEACTQSLSYIKLGRSEVSFEYWPGQPCETDQVITQTLPLIAESF